MIRRAKVGPLLLVAAAMAAACALQLSTSSLVSPFEPSMAQWLDQASALPPAQSWVAPALGTADVRGWQPRALAAEAVALAGGRRATDATTGALIASFVLLIVLAVRRLGSGRLAAVGAALTVVASGALGAAPALSVGLAWQACLAALVFWTSARLLPRPGETGQKDGRDEPPVRSGRLTVVLLGLAVALATDGDASWLILLLPTLPILLRRRERLAAALVLVLAVAGAAHAVAITLATFRAMPLGPGVVRHDAPVAEALRAALLGAGGIGTPFPAGLRTVASSWLAVWGVAGSVFAGAGLVALMSGARSASRRGRAWLVSSWIGAATCLAAARSPLDRGPALVLLVTAGCALAALGATWLLARAPGRRLASAAGLVALVPAVLHLVGPARTPRPFDGAAGGAYRAALLTAAAPARAAFVSDIAPLDRLVLGLPGRERAQLHGALRLPRDPAIVNRFLEAGFAVYALPAGRAELAARGVAFTDRPLAHATLGRYLDTLPDGALTLVAATGGAGEALRHSPLLYADRLGGRRTHVPAAFSYCLAGRAGGRGAVEAASPSTASLLVRAGDPVGESGATAPASIRLDASADAAVVNVVRRGIVRAHAGVAIAVLDALGDLADRLVIDDSTGFQARVSRETLTLAQADRLGACHDLPPGASADVSALAAAGSIGWSVAGTTSGRPVSNARFTLSPADGARVDVPLEGGQRWGIVRLGRVPAAVTATSAASVSLHLCAAVSQERRLFDAPGQRVAILDFGTEAGAFGAGWHLAESDGGVPFRWTAGEALVFVRLEEAVPLRVVLEASPAARPPVAIGLVVNGRSLAAHPMGPGIERYSWDVPADAWTQGLNQVVVQVSPAVKGTTDTRILGAAVRDLRFERP